MSVTFDAEKGPNFAGHYTIAEVSCGTGCASINVVDARTGQIYREKPFGALNVGPFNFGGSMITFDGAEFRLNSRLLVAEGCFDSEERESCARRYYLWAGTRFKLLRTVRANSLK